MYEIEIKAHVSDKDSVKNAISKFAKYKCAVQKHDTYYKLTVHENDVTARIRCENEKITLTYKQKEMRGTDSGTSTEVNSEYECQISCAAPLEKLFADCGFAISHTKEKHTESWTYATRAGDALIELCNVPPLGYFLEVEILANDDDKATVEAAQKELYAILEKCGIDKSAIEMRYYSEMLENITA